MSPRLRTFGKGVVAPHRNAAARSVPSFSDKRFGYSVSLSSELYTIPAISEIL